ncbi:hypothetical protein [Aureibacter tunicatorum]|uniref:Uncharacterized protein n=1 Tax=Aureibacter tunicatorum TaxID=866807 RepID=A0AAE3XLV9_9BACT|nr:hypothetical protein [Aureibacter tunicatorum]MDR6237334.1 hypothetical protein [Aureibacter tunicatorum]BDD06325.1 hypothetical protein AUTU_38080 [Aureibacter tunicatorum]
MSKKQKCYFSGHEADGHPIKLSLFRDNAEKFMHKWGFHSDYEKAIVQLPRSKNAEYLHGSITLLKIVAILWAILYPQGNMYWNILTASFGAGILSTLIYWVIGTKSKVFYLYNLTFWAEILCFMAPIIHYSEFSHKTPYISTKYFLLSLLIGFLLSQLLTPLVKNFFKDKSGLIIGTYPEKMNYLVNNKYEIGISPSVEHYLGFFYRMFKWIY